MPFWLVSALIPFVLARYSGQGESLVRREVNETGVLVVPNRPNRFGIHKDGIPELDPNPANNRYIHYSSHIPFMEDEAGTSIDVDQLSDGILVYVAQEAYNYMKDLEPDSSRRPAVMTVFQHKEQLFLSSSIKRLSVGFISRWRRTLVSRALMRCGAIDTDLPATQYNKDRRIGPPHRR